MQGADSYSAAKELIRNSIETIPDFPKKGIQFRDIFPLLANPEAFDACMNIFSDRYRDRKVDAILGIEARGFIFGAVLAHMRHIPFVPVRKHRKLPGETLAIEYDKEYGKDSVEIQKHALKHGQNVVIIDDLIGTGGSAEAALKLTRMAGAAVLEIACIVELTGLGGRQKLSAPLFSILQE